MLAIIFAIILITLAYALFYRRKSFNTHQKPQQFFKDYSIDFYKNNLSKISPQKRSEINSLIDSLITPYPKINYELKHLDQSSIILITEEKQFYEALSTLKNCEILGIDVEEHRLRSYLGFICLIQISTPEFTYLFDAIKLRNYIPELSTILENPNICKILHSCNNDIQWLQRDFGICMVNVYDTQIAARLLNFKNLGLNSLWSTYCNYHMTSEEKKYFQTSDWRLRPLSKKMLEYAARDAHYMIYLMSITVNLLSEEQLRIIRSETNEICKNEYGLKDISSELCEKAFKKYCKQPLDVQTQYILFEFFKLRDRIAVELDESCQYICPTDILVNIAVEKPRNLKQIKELIVDSSKIPMIKRSIDSMFEIIAKGLEIPYKLIGNDDAKSQRNNKKINNRNKLFGKHPEAVRDHENYEVQKPDGTILCYVSKSKSNWYLEKGLATLIEKDPQTIRLNFEPKSNGYSDISVHPSAYTIEKKKKCVVCGFKGDYLKYHVVPLLYRQAFPENYKSHRCHDVVKLCIPHHEQANKFSEILKQKISIEYNVPLHEVGEMHKINRDLKSTQKICIQLLKHGEKMPNDKKNELEEKVMDFLNSNEEYKVLVEEKINGDMNENKNCLIEFLAQENNVQEILNLHGDVNWKKQSSNMHGIRVLEKVGDLQEFINRWRVNFIETMNPKFLPKAWQVDAKVNLGITL